MSAGTVRRAGYSGGERLQSEVGADGSGVPFAQSIQRAWSWHLLAPVRLDGSIPVRAWEEEGGPDRDLGTAPVDQVGRPSHRQIANPMGTLAVRMPHDPTITYPRRHDEDVSILTGRATADDQLLDRAEPDASPNDPHKSVRRAQEQQAEDRAPERRASHISKGAGAGRIVRFCSPTIVGGRAAGRASERERGLADAGWRSIGQEGRQVEVVVERWRAAGGPASLAHALGRPRRGGGSRVEGRSRWGRRRWGRSR